MCLGEHESGWVVLRWLPDLLGSRSQLLPVKGSSNLRHVWRQVLPSEGAVPTTCACLLQLHDGGNILREPEPHAHLASAWNRAEQSHFWAKP